MLWRSPSGPGCRADFSVLLWMTKCQNESFLHWSRGSQTRQRAMCSASYRWLADSCMRWRTTMGWSSTTSTPTPLHKRRFFATVCEGYLGTLPHWNLWLHLVNANMSYSNEGGVKKTLRVGGCTL